MKGSIVFVTGANRGLGDALVRELAAREAVVYAGDHAPGDKLKGVTRLPLDVRDVASLEACARRIEGDHGHVDLVINNAAILGDLDRGGVGTLDYERMLQVFDTNTLGPLRVSQTFWPLLRKGTTKLLVNISSEAGSIAQCGRDGWFGYGMSKAALNMASVQFHNAIRGEGGRVLLLHPGWVQTWMQGRLDTSATFTPAQSATKLVNLIETRGGENHERPLFLQWDGQELPW